MASESSDFHFPMLPKIMEVLDSKYLTTYEVSG